MIQFIINNIYIILFYLVVGILIFIFRRKFQLESGFILLLRTKLGLKFMNKLSRKYRALIKLFGYSGIGFGFAGMILVSYYLVKSAVDVFISKTATQGVTLVLPGTNIPGVGVLNFSYWIITLFIIALIHEFSHGVVARANKVRVKSSGIVFFGPIIGAFVEPNEKQVEKSDPVVQYSIFSAGPFSNILLAGLVILIMNLFLAPAFIGVSQSNGVYFSSVEKGLPAFNAGIRPNVVITQVNNQSVKNINDFFDIMLRTKPNETLVFKDSSNKTYKLTTTVNPEDKSRGFIGVVGINAYITPKKGRRVSFNLLKWFYNLFKFLGILSLGIGLFNLLPLGIVDGGRMLKTFLEDSMKNKKKSTKVWMAVSFATLLILIFDIVAPFLMKLF